MNYFVFIISQVLLIITLLFNSPASGEEVESMYCRRCHEDTYMKAVSYRYQHSVVRDQCRLCHVASEIKDSVISRMDFPALQRDWLIYLGRLSENREYQAEVIITDSSGRSYTPAPIDIVPENIWEQDGQTASLSLKKLSNVEVDKIQKQGFVSVSISWATDAFATSEIECRLMGERASKFKVNFLYTKSHNIVLDGLKHNSKYSFSAVSSDIYGNNLKSEEYSFDTYIEFSRGQESGYDDLEGPVIKHMQVFRTGKNEGLYLKVSANKLSEISVKIKEGNKMDEKHDFGLLPARYSRIDICLKCHPQNSSHPVGVKAESPKIRTPKDLPTIDGGIITCVTCHTPHGGDREHFNRFDFRKDLCMKCHLEKYDNL